MMYHNNFIATVKVGGKILRENKDVVALPFGSEYSIYLKNQNSVRAIVRVSIDGKPLSDVADGWFIIGANDTLDLERFVRNGNFQKGNRLKFIERTAQIEAHKGGIGIEDGLIRVEYKFEKVVQQWLYNNLGGYTIYGQNCGNLQGGQTLGNINTCENLGNASNVSYTVNTTVTTPSGSVTPSYTSSSSKHPEAKRPSFSGNMLRSARIKGPSGQSRSVQAQQMNAMSMDYMETSLNDAGITVAGGESNQKFGWGAYFPTEDTSHVIVLKLVGKVSNNILVAQPVTVYAKPTCSTCGKVGKATSKFCGRCGTALQLL